MAPASDILFSEATAVEIIQVLLIHHPNALRDGGNLKKIAVGTRPIDRGRAIDFYDG